MWRSVLPIVYIANPALMLPPGKTEGAVFLLEALATDNQPLGCARVGVVCVPACVCTRVS